MRIGILALQGAFAEHQSILDSLGVHAVLVRASADLQNLDGLILPGGESTSMRRLAGLNGLDAALKAYAASHSVWGVCAGMILMAAEIEDEEPFLGCLDITVNRNAYGRQQDSFVAQGRVAEIAEPEQPVCAIFIRAPRIAARGTSVRILAQHNGEAVAVRQGRLIATAFHPELTRDTRMHRLFLEMCGA